jgi:NADH-quinone oxidoreductase subunit L
MNLDQPGLLYVAATLLPLASFVLLLLYGGLRFAVRPYRDRDRTLGHALWNAFGGERPARWPAYVATGAIALSCVLSLYGLALFLGDEHGHGEHAAAAHAEGAEQGEAKPEEKAEAPVHGRWADRLIWISLDLTTKQDTDPDFRYHPAPRSVLELGYRIDSLAAVMFAMVTFVATLIHVFSIGYMAEEKEPEVEDHQAHVVRRGRFGRFFMFLSLFCFSMLNLLLADNLFQVFLSWELVGVCSYLLISFYYERHSASTAANKAFITNRVGDAGFIIGLLILWTYLGTFNFQDIFAQIRGPVHDANGPSALAGKIVRADVTDQDPARGTLTLVPSENGAQAVLFPAPAAAPKEGEPKPEAVPSAEIGKPLTAAAKAVPGQYGSIPYWLLVLAGLGIFTGCVGKSAQFPLQVWLPDAMEGPTPVSALIHAATMVAAGVYLVGRCYPLFTPEALLVIAYVGGITLFVAATVAVVMTDIKKVLAYSTVSQLGFMMLALGVGGWVAGLFHLLTHAFFKALLFLGSGSVIYGCHHEQDMARMGGLYPKMKVTALTMLVGVLAIAGIPGFSGWYSKDAILVSAYGFASVHREHALLFLLPLLTAGLTAFYMFRMWFLTFTGKPRDEHVYEHAHESPRSMTVPLVLLAVMSVVVAWGWPFFSTGFPFLNADASWVAHQLHESQPDSVKADFGVVEEEGEVWDAGPPKPAERSERVQAAENHAVIGNVVLGAALLGIVFAALLYYYRTLDPRTAKQQFPWLDRLLVHKWYFDELYSAVLVRPTVVVGYAVRWFDLTVIDGFLHFVAWGTVRVSKFDGLVDYGIVDGLVNLTARVVYGVGGWLRTFQTGSLRSYVLFLALAAVAIFLLFSWILVAMAGQG